MLVTDDNNYPRVYGYNKSILYVVAEPGGWPFLVEDLGNGRLQPRWWSRSFMTEGVLMSCCSRQAMPPALRKAISELTWSDQLDACNR